MRKELQNLYPGIDIASHKAAVTELIVEAFNASQVSSLPTFATFCVCLACSATGRGRPLLSGRKRCRGAWDELQFKLTALLKLHSSDLFLCRRAHA